MVVAVFTAVLGREGLIYAHFDMTANTSSPVSAAPQHSREREREREREKGKGDGSRYANEDKMPGQWQSIGPCTTCSDLIMLKIMRRR